MVVDRWFPSSRARPGRGTAKLELSLKERSYLRMSCGLLLERGPNPAINPAAIGGPPPGDTAAAV